MDFKSWINLIENRIFFEITRELADDIKNWYKNNMDELPFGDIFGPEKTRLVIPLGEDTEVESILEKLKSLNAKIDFSTGLLFMFDQKAEKMRQIKLGKFLLDKKSPFTEEEKNWWIKSGNPVQELKLAMKENQENPYVIVVSRHPIDLVRMSDHDNWTSCHAPRGGYFQCALADARGAGAIAYVVQKTELNNVNLDADEIFKDAERGIRGLEPLARVRLRKFVHTDDGYDLAVPENRVYGDKFPGFLETVRTWALQKQSAKIGSTRPRMRDFELKGGSYRDTTAGKLFNYFFSDSQDLGDAKYTGEEDDSGMAEIWEQEVDETTRYYRDRIKNFFFGAEVDVTDGEPYVSIFSGMMFPLSPSFKEKIDLNILRDWRKQSEIIRQINSQTQLPRIGQIDVHGSDIYFNFESEGMTPDDYAQELYELGRLDDDVTKIRATVYDILRRERVLPSTLASDFTQDYDYDDEPFKHFILDEDNAEWTLELKDKIKVKSEDKYTSQETQNDFKKIATQQLQNWADQILNTKKRQKMLFDPQFANFYKRSFAQEFKIDLGFEIRSDYQKQQPPYFLDLNLKIDFTALLPDEDFLEVQELVRFLDDNYEQFKNLMQKSFLAALQNQPKR
jgi:hypothetical protein